MEVSMGNITLSGTWNKLECGSLVGKFRLLVKLGRHFPNERWMMMENKRYGELKIENHWMDKLLKEAVKIDELSINGDLIVVLRVTTLLFLSVNLSNYYTTYTLVLLVNDVPAWAFNLLL
ncbi:hypothetical protein Tco_1155134 [Tanacetum coccineum]